ncbi:MAG TPA: signal peptidase I [Allosphingosinicella sp.]|nr:signal peptidase I [Allosphingosinicella sp.]
MENNEQALPRRSFAGRAGIALLNLLTPGIGLVRLGHWRAGFGFAAGILIALLMMSAAAAALPTITPTGYAIAAGLLICFALFSWIAPIVMTWRASRAKPAAPPWWGRSYSLLGLVIFFQLASHLSVELFRGFYRPFYMPAESMHPTILVGERLVADMRGGRAPRRGDIILFNVGEALYIKRVAALAGDRIAIRKGVPIVNGLTAMQRKIGTTRMEDVPGDRPVDVLVERLPGEAGEHWVLDMGEWSYDDMEDISVPPGHLFVLGDNRDRSADSRVARELGGVEMLPVADVVGRPLFKTWTAEWRWLGTPIR